MAKRRIEPATNGTGGNDEPGFDANAGSLDGGVGSVGGGDGVATINPADLGSGNIDGTEGTGKRTRKPRTPKAAKSAPLDLESIKSGLVISHMVAASMFSASELALTETQAEAYAKATSEVLKFYDLGTTAKAMAWGNLIMAMGGIYYTKITQISQRKAADRAKQVQASRASMQAGAMPQAMVMS